MYAQEVDLEQILSKFKLSGPYYVKLFSLLIFSGVTNVFYSVNYVFISSDVGYRCRYPECENRDALFTDSPFNLSNLNQCSRYVSIGNGTCAEENVNKSHIIRCKEWIYEENFSFVEELQIECEDWKRTLVGTVHSIGYMIGLLITGPLADKIGRKMLIVFSGLTAAFMGIGKSFTSIYWIYIALEMLEALFGDTYSATFMLGVEMVTKENRVFFITIMTASTSLAGVLMALIAWLTPNWRYFLRVVYGPSILFVFYSFFLDESVRWLLIQRNIDDAKNILKKAAKLNRSDVSKDTIDKVKIENVALKTDFVTLIKMTFSSRKLLLRFLACTCMWITGLFNKYALLITSVELEGNKHVNFGLTTFSELPASFAIAYVLKKFKRKMPLIFSFTGTGLFCIAQSLLPKGNPWLSTALFLAGKFMATISYATVYLYTSELFPTYTRNTMHALCSSIGRIASISAPQLPLLMVYWKGLPSVLVGALSLFTGIIVILMPETSEDALPDTVCEAEAMGNKLEHEVQNVACTKL